MIERRAPWVATTLLLLVACGSNAERSPEPVPVPADAVVAPMSPDAQQVLGNLASRTVGMILIPAGPYYMPAFDPFPDGPIDEVPAFYIDRLEVTVADYRRCVEARQCEPPVTSRTCATDQNNWGRPDRDQHPVNCVRESDAGAYCAFRGVHLPTKWHWAKAARGEDQRQYPWGDAPPTCKLAVIARGKGVKRGCGRGGTWPVGSRPEGASPYGILDLAGNVEEFTTIDEEPVDPTDAVWLRISTISRGGSFLSAPDDPSLRVSGGGSGIESPYTGFRCAFQSTASLKRRRN